MWKFMLSMTKNRQTRPKSNNCEIHKNNEYDFFLNAKCVAGNCCAWTWKEAGKRWEKFDLRQQANEGNKKCSLDLKTKA